MSLSSSCSSFDADVLELDDDDDDDDDDDVVVVVLTLVAVTVGSVNCTSSDNLNSLTIVTILSITLCIRT
jgi:hypothetical protein